MSFNAKNIPSGSRFRVNVSNEYAEGDEVAIYAQGEGGLKAIDEAARVEDGMLEFELASSSKYFIATIPTAEPEKESETEGEKAEKGADFTVAAALVAAIGACAVVKIKRGKAV